LDSRKVKIKEQSDAVLGAGLIRLALLRLLRLLPLRQPGTVQTIKGVRR
jgi:hypothetical protein